MKMNRSCCLEILWFEKLRHGAMWLSQEVATLAILTFGKTEEKKKLFLNNNALSSQVLKHIL